MLTYSSGTDKGTHFLSWSPSLIREGLHILSWRKSLSRSTLTPASSVKSCLPGTFSLRFPRCPWALYLGL